MMHDLLVSYLCGDLSTPSSIDEVANITRLIVCGNSLALPTAEDILARTTKDKFGSDMVIYDPEPLISLDSMLFDVGSTLVVDLMSGDTDPTSALVPQHPIVRSIFKKSSGYNTFSTVSNPFEFKSNSTTLN